VLETRRDPRLALASVLLVGGLALACAIEGPAPAADEGGSSPTDADTGPGSDDGGDGDGDDGDGDGLDADDGLKYDIGVKLDFEPGPPDPFPTAPLGCEGVALRVPLLAIDFAGAFVRDDGAIRLRLQDEGREHWWDIVIDLEPAAELPAEYYAVPFAGHLSVPSLWEWWHGSIHGSVNLTLVQADFDGCLVAAITDSTNDWGPPAPPQGWLVVPVQRWE
jgi:hypothetical protein